MGNNNPFGGNVFFEMYEGEPEFPCLCVPMEMGTANIWIEKWERAWIAQSKIRGAAHYYNIVFSNIYEIKIRQL